MLVIEQILENIKLIDIPEEYLKSNVIGSLNSTMGTINLIYSTAMEEKRMLSEEEEKEMTRWMLWLMVACFNYLEVSHVEKADTDKLKNEMEKQFAFVRELMKESAKNKVSFYPFSEENIKKV